MLRPTPGITNHETTNSPPHRAKADNLLPDIRLGAISEASKANCNMRTPAATARAGAESTSAIANCEKASAIPPRRRRFGEPKIALRLTKGLTMRLSDAGWRRCKTKLIYPNHRLPPWFTEDATPRSLEPIVRPTTAPRTEQCTQKLLVQILRCHHRNRSDSTYQ
jgi:hypothetical protein